MPLAKDPIGRAGVGLTWPDPRGGPHVCSASHTPCTAPITQQLLLQGTACAGRAQPSAHGGQIAHRQGPAGCPRRRVDFSLSPATRPPAHLGQTSPPLSAPAAASLEWASVVRGVLPGMWGAWHKLCVLCLRMRRRVGQDEREGFAVGIFAGFPLSGDEPAWGKGAALISSFMSGQDCCFSEHKAASRLLSHLRRAQGSGVPG